MKTIIKIAVGGIVLLLTGCFINPAPALSQARIEQENRLIIPQGTEAETWNFLKSNLVDNPQILSQIDQELTAETSEETFIDTYYDTAGLNLLNKFNSVRHRRRENLTNPEDRKSGRELVQIKISDLSENLVSRKEMKYEVDLSNADPDQHPLIGIIKPSQRKDFINALRDLDITANSLRPIINLNDHRKRVTISKNGQPFITISLDTAAAATLWQRAEFSEIEFELNEIVYTSASPEDKEYMETISGQLSGEIRKQFNELTPDLTPKYNKAFRRLEAKIPWYRFLIRWGII